MQILYFLFTCFASKTKASIVSENIRTSKPTSSASDPLTKDDPNKKLALEAPYSAEMMSWANFCGQHAFFSKDSHKFFVNVAIFQSTRFAFMRHRWYVCRTALTFKIFCKYSSSLSLRLIKQETFSQKYQKLGF